MSLDLYLFKLLYDFPHRYGVLIWLANFISNYLIYFLVLTFILFLFFKVSSRERLYLLSLTILSIVITRGIVTEMIRFFYYRSRPFIELNLPVFDHAVSGSLPSGHMTFLIPMALAAWCENRKLGAWLFGLTILIGVTRVASGFHWPTDIISGIAIGAIFFYLIKRLLPRP
mgnify:CR=1 FL=1